MTRYEELLTGVIARQIAGATPRQAAAHLLAEGLLNHRACEQHVAFDHITQLGREGAGRCDAMLRTAKILCCSYAKVRMLYYNYHKKRSK